MFILVLPICILQKFGLMDTSCFRPTKPVFVFQSFFHVKMIYLLSCTTIIWDSTHIGSLSSIFRHRWTDCELLATFFRLILCIVNSENYESGYKVLLGYSSNSWWLGANYCWLTHWCLLNMENFWLMRRMCIDCCW